MVDEPKDAAASVEAPKPREPMTAPQWVAKMNVLIEEGKAEGLNPIQLMLGIILEQTTGFVRTVLAALDTAPAKKK